MVTSAVLFTQYLNSNKELVFHTLSGDLSAKIHDKFIGINLPLAVDVKPFGREEIEDLLHLTVGNLSTYT